MQTIGGILEIKGNDALANLTGMTRLEHVGGLSITYNQLLPTCFANAFSSALGLTNSTISDNATTCPP